MHAASQMEAEEEKPEKAISERFAADVSSWNWRSVRSIYMRFYFPLGLMKEQIKHSRTSTYAAASESPVIYKWIINKNYLSERATDAQRYNDGVIDSVWWRKNNKYNQVKSQT